MIQQIGLIFIFAWILAVIFMRLKQPLIPAYVLAGVLIGPLFLNWANRADMVAELSEVAIVIMLFVIGIEMDIDRLKKIGLVAILGSIIQVSLTFVLGFYLARFFGQSNIAACYFGFGASFSSTMLVVKILGEKYDMDSLYGRIAVGMLIMQDILAILALSVVTTVDKFSPGIVLSTLTTTAGLILIVVFILGRYVLPYIFDYVAHEREVLFTAAMAVLFLAGFYAENQKLSMGIGSFLAGLAMARLSYRYEIVGDLKAMKTFFILLFFAALGLQLAPPVLFNSDMGQYARLVAFWNALASYGWLIICFSILVIVIKPTITTMIVSIFGYEKSTAFNAGIALGNFSEFSLVLLAQGIAAKHVDPAVLPAVIIMTVVSMTLSSYIMKFNLFFYKYMSKFKLLWWLDKLSVFEKNQSEEQGDPQDGFEILLVGCDRLGFVVERALSQDRKKYLVVDSNPDVIVKLRGMNVPCIFGDVNNHEVLGHINFENIKTVFSSIPDIHDNELLLSHIKNVNPEINFIGITETRRQAEKLYELGAHFVLVYYLLASSHLLCSRGDKGAILNSLLDAPCDIRQKGAVHRKRMATGNVLEICLHDADCCCDGVGCDK